jgi:hypothetical protein
MCAGADRRRRSGQPPAGPTSGRLAASRRDDRDRPCTLRTPCIPMRTAGALPTAPAGPIDTPTRPRYPRAARSGCMASL